MRDNWLKTLIRKFGEDHRGVAAIEGAILLPVIVAVFMGMIDLSSAQRLGRDLERAAASVAAITVSETRFDALQQQKITNGLRAMMPTTSDSQDMLSVSVRGITNNNGTYQTDWTWEPQGQMNPINAKKLFKNALPNGASGVVVYVEATHKSFFESGAFGNYTLNASYAARPNKGTRILN